MRSSSHAGVPGTSVMSAPRCSAACQIPKTAPDGSEAIARRPASPAVQRADADGAAAVPYGRRRPVRVVRGEVRRPGDGEMAVGRQLADARHLVSVEQCPHVRAELLRAGLELPAEQRPVEVLGRGHPVHHQAHPAGCARWIRRTVQPGRPPCLGHRHSLLGPSRRPCPSALRTRVPRPRAITPRADARTTRGATGPRRTACATRPYARMPGSPVPAAFRVTAVRCPSAVRHVPEPVRLVIGTVRRAE